MNVSVLKEVPTNQAGEAAWLVHSALSEYYSLFSSDLPLILSSIERQLFQLSELDQTLVAVADGRVVGVACYYAVSEMEKRQMASFVDLMSVVPDRREVNARLRSFARHITPLAGPGMYLSRLAVVPACFGSGIAAKLMQTLEEETRSLRLGGIFLHVNRANHRAVAFYRKYGLAFQGESITNFGVMHKPVSEGD